MNWILVVVANVVKVLVVFVVPVVVLVTVVVYVAVVIVVLRLTKNASLWNDALAYHMTMAGGLR